MKFSSNIIVNNRMFRHIIFWAVYLFISVVMYGSSQGDYFHQLRLHLSYLPVLLAATYFTLYFLIPKYLIPKRTIKFSVLFIITAFIFSFLQRLNLYFFVIPLFYPEAVKGFEFLSFQIIFRIFAEYPVVIFAASIKIILHWYQNQQINQHLAQEKLEAELKFLKAQIHPHFLFNTLNNLYALTLKKSDQAPEVVLKISKLLNYMLYESNVNEVSLKKEVDLVKDYIELEKIRYGQKLKINFIITGETVQKRIAPLLLLPFVENSFKHGVSKKLSDKWININLKLVNKTMFLSVENSKSNDNVNTNREYTEGIGLKNVKRRLDLLYNGRYNLKTNDAGDTFLVALEIELENKPMEPADEN